MQRGRDMAYEVLRHRVISGYYKAGIQLKEEPLARELGLSRTPVRTALKRLVEDGLATADVGQGIHVAEWNDWEIEETFQLRMLLEPYAASLAAERASDATLARLRASNQQMAAAIKEGGVEAIIKIQEANRTFHHTLLESAGSSRLRSMLETLIDIPIIVRSFYLSTPEELEQSLHHHQDLTLAIELRDGELARQVMQLHLRMSYKRFIQHRKEHRGATGQ
ncbi:GntR family transcriptional regulator [Noviherbaspirillum sp. L7-7A]|uniref:GntR family transcriptional regulator n=1 Tax=Noviherbaspirillum sp. L7-7A TaxID=2850560 RepID=UPI001C2BA477|nr:GntR family transcriptional regulator [Noviherbaspirillum sp. L7-7A]MBV0881451.1 GntR family transcriptional regulator [Noviherbaspirillum sp. L7-7A]